VGSRQSVPLADITVQYWFNGPEGIELDPASPPNLLFQLVCSDATTGSIIFPQLQIRTQNLLDNRCVTIWRSGRQRRQSQHQERSDALSIRT